MKKLILFLGCIVCILIIFVVIKSIKDKNNNQYHTITPTIQTIERKIIVPGVIVPSKEIDIKSTISGVMEELYVRVGDHVTKGQAIAKIKFVSEPKEYQSYLRRFQIAEAQYKNSKKNFERDEILYKKGVIAKVEYDNSLTNYLTTKAEYEAAQKELQFVEGVELKESGISNVIYSTDDGISKFDIEADVVITGQETLFAGFSANAEIVLERKDSILSLEEKYFIFRNDSIYVEVVENNKLRQIKIETGISDGIHTEIVSGLEQTSQIHVKE